MPEIHENDFTNPLLSDEEQANLAFKAALRDLGRVTGDLTLADSAARHFFKKGPTQHHETASAIYGLIREALAAVVVARDELDKFTGEGPSDEERPWIVTCDREEIWSTFLLEDEAKQYALEVSRENRSESWWLGLRNGDETAQVSWRWIFMDGATAELKS
jgi:hypothetical protein